MANQINTTVDDIVDEAPISPVKNTGRRKSLEKYLQDRPKKSDLIEKNILPASNAAPAIQAQQKELEKHMLADKLDHALQKRPEKDELVESTHANQTIPQNILPAGHAAPALQAHQKELEKHMRADKLDHALANRKSPDELVKAGVLREDPRSPEEKYADAIEDEYAKREGGA
ncbi:hypothetical protein MKZ38_001753 [Zalerion maritima]|uniref:RPEL repeat protein n=1 Tax=Zalerion maritima TaxID=339359 RepID=A0AAD5RYY3_9PEZI|nr:hypothetical protein MKZ38_001753 [Zalerion maritima]